VIYHSWVSMMLLLLCWYACMHVDNDNRLPQQPAYSTLAGSDRHRNAPGRREGTTITPCQQDSTAGTHGLRKCLGLYGQNVVNRICPMVDFG